jgi:DNA-binding GntR family transcriptional regulator
VDVEIAARTGASRMPVRDALLRLTHEGYLVATTRGFMLPRLSSQDIAEIFEIRKLLESRAAAHAARDLDGEAVAVLGRALGEAERAKASEDVDLLYTASVTFRSTWLAAVSNRRLASAIERYSDHVQTIRYATMRDPPTHAVIVQGQGKLFEAFARRDSVAAHDCMRQFIESAERRFLALAGEPDEHTTYGASRTRVEASA